MVPGGPGFPRRWLRHSVRRRSRLKLEEPRRFGDVERPIDVALGADELGALVDLADVAGEYSAGAAGGAVRGGDRQAWSARPSSAMQMSSSASQHSSTWARMRSSLRWWTGRRSRWVLMSRQPRSTSMQLFVAGRCPRRTKTGAEQLSSHLPSRWTWRRTAVRSMRSSPAAVTRRNRCRPGIVRIWPRSSARLVADSASEPSRSSVSRASIRSRTVASRSACPGSWQTMNRSASTPLPGARVHLSCRAGCRHRAVAAGAVRGWPPTCAALSTCRSAGPPRRWPTCSTARLEGSVVA